MLEMRKICIFLGHPEKKDDGKKTGANNDFTDTVLSIKKAIKTKLNIYEPLNVILPTNILQICGISCEMPLYRD